MGAEGRSRNAVDELRRGVAPGLQFLKHTHVTQLQAPMCVDRICDQMDTTGVRRIRCVCVFVCLSVEIGLVVNPEA